MLLVISVAVLVTGALVGAAAPRQMRALHRQPRTAPAPHTSTPPQVSQPPAASTSGAPSADVPVTTTVPATAASPVTPTVPVIAANSVPTPAPVRRVVALGDSVPAGTACGCAPYPALLAQQIARTRGLDAPVDNLAVPGLTSGGLLAQLGTPSARAVTARGSVVTVMIGANDFDYVPSGACPELDCYAAGLSSLAHNAAALLATIRTVNPSGVLEVLGYWEVWKDGDAGSAKGSDYMAVNDELTERVNAVLAQAAAGAAAAYVDTRAAIHTGSTAAVTARLAPDGDHPDAVGHALIAAALASALPAELPAD